MAATDEAMDALDELADPEFWGQAGAAFAGFLGPTVAKNLIEPNTSYDIPDEVYGMLVVAGAQFAPAYQNELMLGGGLYAVDQFAERFDLKESVAEVGN